MYQTILLVCASSLMLTGCTSDPLAPRPTHTLNLTRSLTQSPADTRVPSRFRDA